MVDTDAAEGELHQVSLAQQDGAGLGEPARDEGIAGRHVVLEHDRSPGSGYAGHIHQILHRNRDALKGAQIVAAGDRLLRRLSRGQSPIRGHGDEGVELRIQAVDALQVILGELDGGDLPLLEEGGQFLNAGKGEGVVHWGHLYIVTKWGR